MNEELKPCPFCGSEALLENTITQASIMCCDCPAVMRRGHTTRSFDDGTHRAITAWNTRATDARITSLEEENARLRDALEPFSAFGRVVEMRACVTFGKTLKDTEIVLESSGEVGIGILTMGHFRDAAALLPDAPGWCGRYIPRDRAALSIRGEG